MVDIVKPQVRSRMMAGIRSVNTSPERVVRALLFRHGFRFRLYDKSLPGKPDVVLAGRSLVIQVYGCFWHLHQGCRFCRLPSTRRKFWTKKLEGNRQRDIESEYRLLDDGWRVIIVWECATRGLVTTSELSKELIRLVRGNNAFSELSSDMPGHIQSTS